MEWDEAVVAFRALGDPTRARIFEFLCTKCGPVAVDDKGEVHRVEGVTVGEVCCHITGQEKFNSSISFHLKELRLAGLITAERQGKFMVCRARPDAILALQKCLLDLANLSAVPCETQPE